MVDTGSGLVLFGGSRDGIVFDDMWTFQFAHPGQREDACNAADPDHDGLLAARILIAGPAARRIVRPMPRAICRCRTAVTGCAIKCSKTASSAPATAGRAPRSVVTSSAHPAKLSGRLLMGVCRKRRAGGGRALLAAACSRTASRACADRGRAGGVAAVSVRIETKREGRQRPSCPASQSGPRRHGHGALVAHNKRGACSRRYEVNAVIFAGSGFADGYTTYIAPSA